jgi:glutaredoxin
MARSILEAFDRLGSEKLASDALAGESRAMGEDRAAFRGLLGQMIEQGYLVAEGEAAYRRTEAGRLAVAGPLEVTLYTRAGCHLCEEAKAQMAPLLLRFGARLREVDIDRDPLLRAQYDYDVPVIFLADRKVAKHRVDLGQFERQLARSSSEA